VPRKRKKKIICQLFLLLFKAQLFDLSCYLGGKLKNRRNKFGVEATGRQKPYFSLSLSFSLYFPLLLRGAAEKRSSERNGRAFFKKKKGSDGRMDD
jgi:hypothetical protein